MRRDASRRLYTFIFNSNNLLAFCKGLSANLCVTVAFLRGMHVSTITLLLLNFTLAAYLTGVIWTVQLVVYPAFAEVAPERFAGFHGRHSTRISWVVLGPMVAELGLAAWLAWQGRATLGAAGWVGLALVVAIWAATFFVSVPFHNRLGQHGYSYVAIDGLVRTNWLRTVLWTVRLALLGWLLTQQLGG